MSENEWQSDLENNNLKSLKSLFYLNEINDDLDTSDNSKSKISEHALNKSQVIDANNNLDKLDIFNKKDRIETPLKKLVRNKRKVS